MSIGGMSIGAVFMAGLGVFGLFTALLAGRRRPSLILNLVFSLAVLGIAVWALSSPKVQYFSGPYLGLDAFRAWFLLILGVVAVVSAWFRFGYRQHDEFRTAFWLPLFLTSMVWVISAQNVWVFMTAWELMSLASFFLVVVHRNQKGVVGSGYIYLVMSQFGALAILSGFLLMASSLQSMSFSVWAAQAHHLPQVTKSWVFGLLALGFGVKSGLIPFHIWLPRAHPVAPAPVSGLMSGVMIKLGVFGIMQFLLLDLGQTSVAWAVLLLLAGTVTGLLGVLYALMEQDLKRLLAYSSIENIGIIFIGLGLTALGIDWGCPDLEAIGATAALLHSLNHAVFKSQLFLAAGAVEQHTGTLDADRLGGLIRTMPGITLGFLAGSMAISALPPFNGFISEWLTFRGLLLMASHSIGWWTILAFGVVVALAMTGAFAAMSFIKASGVIFLGQARESLSYKPIPRSMTWSVLALAVLSLVLGVFPSLMTRVIAGLAPGFEYQATAALVPGQAAEIALFFIITLGIVALLSKVWDVREVPRWSCGRVSDASLQFTSASFSKAVRTSLAVIYRPHRNLERIGPYARDFPERLVYEGGTTPIWERYLYRPSYRFVWWMSRHSTRLQAGPVRLYLTYLLVTIGIMLLFLH